MPSCAVRTRYVAAGVTVSPPAVRRLPFVVVVAPEPSPAASSEPPYASTPPVFAVARGVAAPLRAESSCEAPLPQPATAATPSRPASSSAAARAPRTPPAPGVLRTPRGPFAPSALPAVSTVCVVAMKSPRISGR
jgi:hypothetical protein